MSRGRPCGRPELIRLIRRMSQENPLRGAPRIRSELLLLGYDIAEATVAKYMSRRGRRPPSQTGRTFLRNHLRTTAACDFFVVPTATFRLLFCFVILSHDRRRILHFNVTAHPTAAWAAQQIREILSAPESPWQNPYLERVIGSIRRECLDHPIILNEQHLRRILKEYVHDYNQSRPHLALDRNAPAPRDAEPPSQGPIVAFPEVGGLHHRCTRAA